jgi:hypothetical protein
MFPGHQLDGNDRLFASIVYGGGFLAISLAVRPLLRPSAPLLNGIFVVFVARNSDQHNPDRRWPARGGSLGTDA